MAGGGCQGLPGVLGALNEKKKTGSEVNKDQEEALVRLQLID